MANVKRWLTVSAWARIVPGIKDAFVRFPIPFLCLIAACLVSLLSLHDILFTRSWFVSRSLITLTYGAVALTSLQLFVESKNWSRARYSVAALVVMAIVIGYAWFVFDKSTVSTSVYFASALILSLLFAPYIKSNSDQPSVWYFNYQTGVAVFFAGLAALVLGVGIFIILSSLHYLFDIKIPSKTYGDVWILCWAGLFPIYVLANISRQFDYAAESCGFPKGIRFITNYILLPLMVVYMAILYAYFAKITAQWELPRGKLTWMIAVFGSVGIVTKLLAYPIRDSGTRLLAWFDRYYYYALIVPIILLAIAIGVRIRDYGVTEQRYTVVLMGVWFSCVVLLSIFKRERFHIKSVPMILAALLLVGSYGPWSAAEVSTRSQVSRFKTELSKYQFLQEGQVVKAKTEIPFAERKKLSSIVEYLCASERRFSRIRPWFKTLLLEAGKKETMSCAQIGSKAFVELMGIDYVNRWQVQEALDRFNYNNEIFQGYKGVLDIAGYDFLAQGNFSQYGKNNSCEYKVNSRYLAKDNIVTVTNTDGKLTVSSVDGDKVIFDIGELVREFKKQHISKLDETDKGKMTLTADSDHGGFKARLVLEQIQGSVSTKQELNITFVRYVLMLKFHGAKE